MKNSDSEHTEQSLLKSKQNISRWFWVTIIVLAAVSILLTLLAEFRNSGHDPKPPLVEAEIVEKPVATEIAPTLLERILITANQSALDLANEAINPLLDGAYAPVYAAIPAYTDFHYSLEGQYLELTAAALGKIGEEIQRRLFLGFEERLENVTTEMDSRFESAYREQINKFLAEQLPAESDTISLGPLTRSAIDNAKSRIAITAPMTGLVVIGGAASLKAASLIAKKIGAKIAVKVAAKSGAKWAAAMAGGGTGASVCLWAGPGAGICAAGGALIAWVAVDITVLKLDEFMNRDEFEAGIKTFIDEHKANLKTSLEAALIQKSNRVQQAANREIADFTMETLTEQESLGVCSKANAMIADYDSLRTNLSGRNPASIEKLLDRLKQLEQDMILRPIAQDIRQHLVGTAELLAITNFKVKGNLPEDFRVDRNISGRVSVAGESFVFDRVDATEVSGFVLQASPHIQLDGESDNLFQLTIEQHLWLRNRYFYGAIDLDAFDEIADLETLEQRLTLTLPIEIGDGTESVPGDNEPVSGHPVELELTFSGDELTKIKHNLNCP